MTENEREAGIREGTIDATLKEYGRRIAAAEKVAAEVPVLKSRLQTVWSALASVAALAGGLAFKIWTGS